MNKIIDRAANYALEKTNEMFSQLVAQAFSDGYREGYKDREEEIQVDLRDNKTEYVDLGLPSGTLWSSDYEKEGNKILYLRFSESQDYSIPTKDQWEELCTICKWERILINDNTIRIDCIGPEGKISFYPTGKITNELIVYPDICYFWLNETTDSFEKTTSYIGYNKGVVQSITTNYIGYKLPIRLVRNK